jgi:hypothetical protein
VKTQNRIHSQKIGLPERAVFNSFRSGNGWETPEFDMTMRFHTASVDCALSVFAVADVQIRRTDCLVIKLPAAAAENWRLAKIARVKLRQSGRM